MSKIQNTQTVMLMENFEYCNLEFEIYL